LRTTLLFFVTLKKIHAMREEDKEDEQTDSAEGTK
jgi:hypothetical protein